MVKALEKSTVDSMPTRDDDVVNSSRKSGRGHREEPAEDKRSQRRRSRSRSPKRRGETREHDRRRHRSRERRERSRSHNDHSVKHKADHNSGS
jgi:hypothetical protein